LNGTGNAKLHTARVTAAKITAEHFSPFFIEPHTSQGAYGYTCPTADAQVLVYRESPKRIIPLDGIYWTDTGAKRLVTVLTEQGEIRSFLFQFDHANPCPGRITDPFLLN
jgi:hypothetical protein